MNHVLHAMANGTTQYKTFEAWWSGAYWAFERKFAMGGTKEEILKTLPGDLDYCRRENFGYSIEFEPWLSKARLV